MEDKERKIKEVLSKCERLCPNVGDQWSPYSIVAMRLPESEDAARTLYLEKKRRPLRRYDDYFVLVVFGEEHVLSQRTLANANRFHIELFFRLLSLGVQSPAPDEKDENGLLPCPAIKWEQSPSNKNRINGKLPSFCGQWYSVTKNKDGGKYSTWRGGGIGSFDTQEEAMRHCEEQWYKLWTDEMMAWNTRAHATSAGKDRTNEAIRVCADFAEAVVSSLKEKHRSLKSKHERGVSKLIEALEWVAREIGEPDHPNSYTIEKVLQGIEDALAAYKGKEGETT